MRVARQRTGVLPLRLIARGGRQRHLKDLVLGVLAGVAVLNREALEEVQVESDFLFGRERRLEVGVAERDLLRATGGDHQRFILGIVRRTQAGRPVRRAQLELVHTRNLEIFRHAVRTRGADVGLATLGRTEERRFVAADHAVDDIAILELKRRHKERVLGAQRFRARARRHRRVRVRRICRELRHPRHHERGRVYADEGVALILVHVRNLGRVREPAVRAHGGQRDAGVVRAIVGRLLEQRALVRTTGRVQEAHRSEVLVVLVRLVVVKVAFRRQPAQRTPTQLGRARKTVAVIADLALREAIQRIVQVARLRRLLDDRIVRRAILVLREQVDVRLKEAQAKEDARVFALVGVRTAIEGAGREVQIV